MKNAIIVILVLATAGLTAVCFLQRHKHSEQQTQLQVLHNEVDQKKQEVDELQASQERLERQRRELASQSDAIGAELRAQQATEAKLRSNALAAASAAASGEGKSEDGKGDFGKMISKMMQDPDTRKFIRDQQRMTMNQLYAPLIKRLGLKPEEAEQFKDLLADNMMKGAEKATSMFGGGLSGTNQAALMADINAEQKKADEQVKAFLGEDRYNQYKDYQLTVAERTQLNLFKQQTGDGPNALTDQQTEQLLTFMHDEKETVTRAMGSSQAGASPDQANLEAMLSDDKASKLFEAQQEANGRIYERASQILNADQLASFGQFQTNQLQMMRMGMGMARKMFGGDKKAGN